MKLAVVDASVVLKWYLDDEEHGHKAMNLLNRFIANELDIIAPSLLEYEVLNGLLIAQKRGRIREENLITAISGFKDLGITLKNILPFYSKVIHYCKAYGRSVYDASYMAVAVDEGAIMITSDRGLFNTTKKDLKWVKWLEDI